MGDKTVGRRPQASRQALLLAPKSALPERPKRLTWEQLRRRPDSYAARTVILPPLQPDRAAQPGFCRVNPHATWLLTILIVRAVARGIRRRSAAPGAAIGVAAASGLPAAARRRRRRRSTMDAQHQRRGPPEYARRMSLRRAPSAPRAAPCCSVTAVDDTRAGKPGASSTPIDGPREADRRRIPRNHSAAMRMVSSQISCGLTGKAGLSSRSGRSGSRITVIAARIRPAAQLLPRQPFHPFVQCGFEREQQGRRDACGGGERSCRPARRARRGRTPAWPRRRSWRRRSSRAPSRGSGRPRSPP